VHTVTHKNSKQFLNYAVTPLKIQAANLTLTYYKTLGLYGIPKSTAYTVAFAVLNDPASDPYRPKSNHLL
jgi:hypothetical protein